MKLIVGLGNPGRRYRSTPHNLGFEVVDLLAMRWHASFVARSSERADVAEARVGGETALLAKPSTFMNLSGQSVRALTRNRPLLGEDILIVSDEVNLPPDRLRIRAGGTHGGHNGLRSVINSLGGEDFARLRLGVAPEGPVDDLSDYLLRSTPPDLRDRLNLMVEVAADAVEYWVREGTERTANRYNGFRAGAEA